MSFQHSERSTTSNPGGNGDGARPVNIRLPQARYEPTGFGSTSVADDDIPQVARSPENISSYPSQSLTEYFTPHTPGTIKSPGEGNAPAITTTSAGSSRPVYQRSSTSTSASGHRPLHSSFSTSANSRNSFLRFSHRGRHNRREHEWTVFGELMGQDHDDNGPGSSYSSPLPKPSARESIRDVVSLNLGQTQRPSPMETVPLSPVFDHHRLSTSTSDGESRRSPTPDSLNGISTISERRESSNDSNSETSTSNTITTSSVKKRFLTLPTLTPVQRNILKCCIAYFIGSLFTFSPYLSGFIADLTGNGPGERTPSPSGHMVATV